MQAAITFLGENAMFGRVGEMAKRRLNRLRRNWKSEFYSEVKDIAEHPVVLRMKLYPHHGSTNCYQHCMNVAYYNYQWCRFLHGGLFSRADPSEKVLPECQEIF